MGFLRKLFTNGHGDGHGGGHGGGHHGRRGKVRHERYRADDHDSHEEWWGRHPGSIPPLPPDVVCPQCRKSNPPGTRACRQCEANLVTVTCARCASRVDPGAAFCGRCGNPLSE
ncbi:guanylate cyclase [Caballeronia hypogeia]|uniref:Guanylate cyclase n=1 Tax=Caballeronia hypogeia TaxID=1777140 RepID=A0A158A3E2_9BURK|nr:guanylate cyclase [Caballeronia hypogeia]